MNLTRYDPDAIRGIIFPVRGLQIIVDVDLARLYGVSTKRLNEQVRRNRERFPADFVFPLSPDELATIKQSVAQAPPLTNWSQIATSSQKHRKPRFPPNAFTEHGAIMAANVLNSPQAVRMSVLVVRAFVRLRRIVAENVALTTRLRELEALLTSRLDSHERAIVRVLEEVLRLLSTPPEVEPPPRRMGFNVRERRTRYRAVAQRS